jgi:hypothetical protein
MALKAALSGRLLVVLFFAVASAASSQAQLTKVFVASYGNDANDGSRGSPKRNFQAAHNAVAASGEIVALDTAGFGPLTITKAVSITAPPGITAFITPIDPNGSGITINAGSGDTVTLRGLNLNSTTGSTAGIFCQNQSDLQMFDCTINGFFVGVFYGGAGSGTTTFSMRHCTLRDCSSAGLNVSPSGTLFGSVDDCQFVNNGSGIILNNGARVAVRDSLIAKNGTGISATSNTQVVLQDCLVTNNVAGLNVGSELHADGCTIINNTGQGLIGGAIHTRGNNNVADNNPDGSFTATDTAK